MNTKDLLSYCWKHKLFGDVVTTESVSVGILDIGLYNHNEGPTFFNAKVRVNNMLWAGNVQVVEKASDWYANDLDRDPRYDNVILVVCHVADSEPHNSRGDKILLCQVQKPESVVRNANALTGFGGDYLCRSHICEYSPALIRHAWLAAMQTEWLETKSQQVRSIYEKNKNIEETFFVFLFRSFGYGVNDDAMEELARSIPQSAIERCQDDLFQIEALIFGQAGLLELIMVPEKYQKDALIDGYFAKLRNEYLYLSHKYSMKPIGTKFNPYTKFMHYPHVYLSMIANLIYMRKAHFRPILDCKNVEEIQKALDTHATPYWEMHSQFGAITKKTGKKLSFDRRSYVISTSVIPFLFFYGRIKYSEEICDRAFDFMEQMKPFSSTEASLFSFIKPSSAGDSVGLINLYREYCCKRDCLRCRFGFEFIKKH